MGVNSSKAKYLTDTATAVVLRNVSDGAETATATETAIALGELDLAYWQDGSEIPTGVAEVNIHVTAIDTTSDETYTLDLIVDDVLAMNDTPHVIASLPLVSRQTGFYKMYVNKNNIPLLSTDTSGTEKYLAIRATLGGTTPSITYGASLGKKVANG